MNEQKKKNNGAETTKNGPSYGLLKQKIKESGEFVGDSSQPIEEVENESEASSKSLRRDTHKTLHKL